MSQPVVIKGNKHGIIVVLDAEAEFKDLKVQIEEKFKASAKFFGSADMALGFEGRVLSDEQQREVLDIIANVSQLNIICIIDHDEAQDAVFKAAIDQTVSVGAVAAPAQTGTNDGQFYKGCLRSGQVLETEGSIIVLGDVNPGGRIIAGGSVIILGSLRGNVFAGAGGNEDCFVVALEMNPMQIKIGEVIARSSDSAPRKKSKGIAPKIAYVDDSNIYIEDLGPEVFEDIRINC